MGHPVFGLSKFTFKDDRGLMAVIDEGGDSREAVLVDQLEVGDLDEGDAQLVRLSVDLLQLGDGQGALRLSVILNMKSKYVLD